MIFTSYFDEADTHGPSPTIIMAAFFGHAFQWRRFGPKLAKLQRREGFTIFHAKEFKARSGEFAGWNEDKRQRVVYRLTDIVKTTLDVGMVIALERDRYLKEYRTAPIPKKMNLDSQYGVCFRACLAHQVGLLEKRGFQDRLHVVMESGHPNVGDCQRIFHEMRRRLLRRGIDVLGNFSTALKRTCQPLMVSDFLAAFYSMLRSDIAKGAPHYKDVTNEPPPNQGRLTFLDLLPDALQSMKTQFEDERQAEIDEWRARRAAKKAALAAEQPS